MREKRAEGSAGLVLGETPTSRFPAPRGGRSSHPRPPSRPHCTSPRHAAAPAHGRPRPELRRGRPPAAAAAARARCSPRALPLQTRFGAREGTGQRAPAERGPGRGADTCRRGFRPRRPWKRCTTLSAGGRGGTGGRRQHAPPRAARPGCTEPGCRGRGPPYEKLQKGRVCFLTNRKLTEHSPASQSRAPFSWGQLLVPRAQSAALQRPLSSRPGRTRGVPAGGAAESATLRTAGGGTFLPTHRPPTTPAHPTGFLWLWGPISQTETLDAPAVQLPLTTSPRSGDPLTPGPC